MKSKFIIGLFITLVIGLILFMATSIYKPEAKKNDVTENIVNEHLDQSQPTNDTLDSLVDAIQSGGPPKDGIPPIDQPKYISVDESNYLTDYDKVFVYEGVSEIYIYPQSILVWHEIVNDTIDDQPVSITYCPLTGSTICYLNNIEHPDNTYGTSGKLLNSNLVMYDRKTDSYIPQILGVGINSDLKHITIPTAPIHWADWGDAKAMYPNAKVLSQETGFFRNYDNDPYGTYLPDDTTSYYRSGDPIFPVLNEDNRFSDKKVVVGVKYGDATMAIDPNLVQGNDFLNFEISDLQAMALYDYDLKTVRIFNRQLDGELLSFTSIPGGFQDQHSQVWSYKGQNNTRKLETLTYFDVMWFAWYAYYPDTEVIE